MRIVYGLLIGFFAALIELFAVRFLTVKNVIPTLTPAFILFAAFFGGRRMGMWAGFMAGMILDFYSRYYIGVGIIFYSAAGYILGQYKNRYFFENTMGKIISLLAVNTLQSFIFWISTRPENVLDVFLVSIFPKIFYSTLLGGTLLFLSLLLVAKFSYIAILFRPMKK
ncbi:rod shape-determining protein MreD [candidate division WOR-3 bacterium]|nr:rod shape-determining protein MreD [candidate division WOR-3 bacterium]